MRESTVTPTATTPNKGDGATRRPQNVSSMAAAGTAWDRSTPRSRSAGSGIRTLSTGWAVVEAIAEDGEELVLVGMLAHIEQRDRVRAGASGSTTRYGSQVKVALATPCPSRRRSVAIS